MTTTTASSPAQVPVPSFVVDPAVARVGRASVARFASATVLLAGAAAVTITSFALPVLAPFVLPAAFLFAAVPFAMMWRVDGVPAPRASWALLAAALALTTPLLMHSLTFVWTWEPLEMADTFAGWVDVSLALVGHTHVVFALLCARAAFRAASGESTRLWPIWLVAVVDTFVINGLFYGGYTLLPTAYVGVTAALLLRFGLRPLLERAKEDFGERDRLGV